MTITIYLFLAVILLSFSFLGIAVAWLTSAAFNSALTVPTTFVDEKGKCQAMSKWPSQLHAKVAGILTVVVEYFIPLGILIFCYDRIGFMLRRKLDPTSANMAAMRASEQREKTFSAVAMFVLLNNKWFGKSTV